uniref:Alpha/beta hydrolase fold-3 domain-containing protein n=1 Tax=Zea mays TaxID=4577 RepID=B6U0I6_MAIZE|nr:hypothetical protein [Zea mays]
MNVKGGSRIPVPPPGASALVKVAVFGGAAVYAAMNSLYNVEGGHRAIVFNRIQGKARKARADASWRFLCPGTPGLDDPLSNPFSEAAGGSAARVAAERVLVCVAEKDDLRDRGVWYYESLKASGYPGEVELLESMGEGHVFYCMNPRCDRAREMEERVLGFLRK